MLRISESICDLLETINQKFQTKISKIWEILRHFGNSSVFTGRRVKIQKPLNFLFVLYNFSDDLQSRRSKVKVIFRDPGTFKLKFEYERTLLGNL